MKKLIFVCLLAIGLVACGGSEPEPATETETEAPTVVATTATTPPIPTPHAIPYVPVRHTAWHSFMRVKFSYEHSGEWDLIGRPFPALRHISGQFWGDDVAQFAYLQIDFTTRHPRYWRYDWSRAIAMEGVGRQFWEHPAEACEVFVTDYGITMVMYTHFSFPAFTSTSDLGLPDHNTMFVFRPDGRDYRDFAHTQMIFFALLTTAYGQHDEYLARTRDLLNTIRFYDEVSIGLETTAFAAEMGIDGVNLPRLYGSFAAHSLYRDMMHLFFVPTHTGEHWWQTNFGGYFSIGGTSNSRAAYELLIAGEMDLIIGIAPDEAILGLADALGVEIELIPIALDALVFITYPDNPVTNISIDNIRAIYTDRSISNWAQLGGSYGDIRAYNRDHDWRSQEPMAQMIMRGKNYHPDLDYLRTGEIGVFNIISQGGTPWIDIPKGDFPIGYMSYLGVANIRANPHSRFGGLTGDVAILNINGIPPTQSTIRNNTYPLAITYYAAIRANTPPNAPERAIIAWLQTPDGQAAIQNAGLLPINP